MTGRAVSLVPTSVLSLTEVEPASLTSLLPASMDLESRFQSLSLAVDRICKAVQGIKLYRVRPRRPSNMKLLTALIHRDNVNCYATSVYGSW